MSYYRTFGVNVAVARPFNAYGPRQNEYSYAAVVPTTIRRVLTGEPPIIHGDGLQTRDYTYVEDIIEAIVKMYEVPQTRGRILNIASGNETCIRDLIHLIAKLAGYEGEIIYANSRPGDVRRHKGSAVLANKLLNWSAKTDYETGLWKTVNFYRSHSYTRQANMAAKSCLQRPIGIYTGDV